jgi:hypothetical protein
MEEFKPLKNSNEQLPNTTVQSHQHFEVPNIDQAPPDGGYGWICVISCWILNAFTWGVVAVR